MKYAILKIAGKQYRVSEGENLIVDKIEGKEGEKITLDEVLLLNDGKEIKVGQPKIEGVKVEAEITRQLKGEKIRVAKFKAKSRYRRVKGFRAKLTEIKIIKIS